MFEVRKTFSISAAHKLALNYPSECSNLHGHNWKIQVTCRSDSLNEHGMVMDFKKIKSLIQSELDHAYLNDRIPGNPTAENIAYFIASRIGDICVEVQVEETEGNVALWKK